MDCQKSSRICLCGI
ncbi:hypothetical protein LEMLEM_LOCUS9112 [Lemmus lemmus]